ncbi:MAG: toll/interleukin-1 receptor domain-containing protein, partial [Verrucomicrobia bacterium]|nr:toll/interleukin-1 receptor domain-containing protein [Verrucomicrobiota bacterium]
MEKEFQYYAFISYSHEDEKWAKWIQRRLESYKLPAVIRKEIPRIPKHIRPVFRDRTDLNAGILVEGIRNELNSSKYLIIICSPNSAKSEWVGREIEAFREMGRETNIIPLIVDGKPHSGDDQTECFNPELDKAKNELLGIDVSELGKTQAFIRVVARILELRFQKLWDRYRQQVIRQRIIRAVASLFLLCVLGWVLDCAIPHYKYYADYVDKWGIPEGIVNLTKEQV